MKEKNTSVWFWAELICNILIVVLTLCGIYAMITNHASGTGLTDSGWKNLKYFTVLSNIFCGIVAAVKAVFVLIKKEFPVFLKLAAAAAVGVTFLIVAAFLAPLYPELNLYQGGNLWFHLIVPLVAMAEFLFLGSKEKIPFRYTVFSAVAALAYGGGYLANILINGIGEWPHSNDWYGFLNWGLPAGLAIYAGIVILNWLIAVILRFCNEVVRKIILTRKE